MFMRAAVGFLLAIVVWLGGWVIYAGWREKH